MCIIKKKSESIFLFHTVCRQPPQFWAGLLVRDHDDFTRLRSLVPQTRRVHRVKSAENNNFIKSSFI